LLLEDLPKGSLILADLGYFGFHWFQYLSDCGHFWVSRLKSKTGYEIQHVLYEQGDIAQQAGVEPVEVSVDILMKVLAQAQWPSPFGLAQCLVSHARQIGLIRPSRSIPLELPQIPLQEIIPPALNVPCVRPAKRTVRKTPRRPRRTDPFDFRFFPLLLI
jgi:Transposase DDE domain